MFNILKEKPRSLTAALVVWVGLWSFSRVLLLCSPQDFFATVNVTEECVCGGVKGECKNSHSLGSSCICSALSLHLSQSHAETGRFVCETPWSACQLCLSGFMDLKIVTWYGSWVSGRNTAKFIHILVEGHVLLLFLAKSISSGKWDRSSNPDSIHRANPPFWNNSPASGAPGLGDLSNHLRLCSQKHRKDRELKVQRGNWGG